MTNYELTVVRMAMAHALKVAAPGLSSDVREAILSDVSRRIRYELNIPLMTDRTDPEGGIHGRAV